MIPQNSLFFKVFKKESEKLSLVGIVAEFNPFHNGHKYLINCAKDDGHHICAVISANFVQRGETAIISKFDRTKQALLCGVDIVIELPTPWAMSTAQNFALGAISQLNAIGVDMLYFGSECGSIENLTKAANIISSNEFSKKLKEKLTTNKTFAKLRQELLNEYSRDLGKLLDNPNDTLAIEYIISAQQINPNIKFKAIKRIGAQHNDASATQHYSTATLIREAVLKNKTSNLEKYLPSQSLSVLKSCPKANLLNLETAILSELRRLSVDEISKLPDISEGLENLIFQAIREAKSLDELIEKVKSKRYTHARIRRIILNAFLGIDNSFFKKIPPYVRVLGFNNTGKNYLTKESIKPIITRVSQINLLDSFSKKVFETECRVTDLWALSLESPAECTMDLTTPIIKV